MSARVALGVGVAVAAVGGAAWFLTRRGNAGVEVVDVKPTPKSSGGVRNVGKVYHREMADPLDARLRAALDEYAVGGPWPIRLTSGLRIGPAAEVEQLSYFNTGKSKAKTLDQTPHGRGGAFDFGVVNVPLVSIHTAKDHPELYAQCAAFFEARGLVWGGRFPGFYDGPHIEVPNWRALPYPPQGVA